MMHINTLISQKKMYLKYEMAVQLKNPMMKREYLVNTQDNGKIKKFMEFKGDQLSQEKS